MALFRTKSVHLTSIKTPDRYCSDCQKYDTIVVNVFRKQLFLFGIPILPVGKTGNAFCQNCKKTVEEKDMSELILHDYLLIKNETKGPTWQLSVVLLFLGLAVAVSLVNKKSNKNELEYLSSPAKDDIYEYQIDSAQYSTMKIIKVSADSLHVLLNRHKTPNAAHIYSIDKPENYQRTTIAFERQKINDMYNAGKILDISRKTYKTSDTL